MVKNKVSETNYKRGRGRKGSKSERANGENETGRRADFNYLCRQTSAYPNRRDKPADSHIDRQADRQTRQINSEREMEKRSKGAIERVRERAREKET